MISDWNRCPSVAEVNEKVTHFAKVGKGKPDRALERFRELTGTSLDLLHETHTRALHRWLNAWGCRIPYPQRSGPPMFHLGVKEWWKEWEGRLPPSVDCTISCLKEAEISSLAEAFDELARIEVGSKRRRRLGPTAAAKCLYVVRPRAVVAWDKKIAVSLHGARDVEAFKRHQRLARTFSRSLLEEAGVEEDAFPLRVGRPGSSMAKLLDEYWYVTITRRM